MSYVTGLLLRLGRRIGPSESRELILRVNPATFELAAFADDEITLTMLWGGAVLVATILTIGLAAAGQASTGAGPTGLNVRGAVVAGCFAGLCIHAVRYVIARTASRLGESRYRRLTGRESALAAAMGEQVRERPHPVLSLILRSTDLDLLAQFAVAIAVLVGSR